MYGKRSGTMIAGTLVRSKDDVKHDFYSSTRAEISEPFGNYFGMHQLAIFLRRPSSCALPKQILDNGAVA